MLDLDGIRRANEEAHLRAVERATQKAEMAQVAEPPPVFPLAVIARKLIIGPPALSYLIDIMENSDVVANFHELVREYLPEHETFIMSQDNDGRIREFAYYFGRQYFPLSDNLMLNDYTLGDFLREIPVELMGFSYEDYHSFADFREGYALLLALVESPFADEGGGGRIPILERVKELVGRELVGMIPDEGWTPDDLHRRLDGTEYEGAAMFADWVWENTGCWQLDATYDGYEGERWERHIVDQLTVQWPQVVNIQNKIQEISEWLEEDIHFRYRELLSFLLDRQEIIIPKEQLKFPLDENAQVISKEVISDGNA